MEHDRTLRGYWEDGNIETGHDDGLARRPGSCLSCSLLVSPHFSLCPYKSDGSRAPPSDRPLLTESLFPVPRAIYEKVGHHGLLSSHLCLASPMLFSNLFISWVASAAGTLECVFRDRSGGLRAGGDWNLSRSQGLCVVLFRMLLLRVQCLVLRKIASGACPAGFLESKLRWPAWRRQIL